MVGVQFFRNVGVLCRRGRVLRALVELSFIQHIGERTV